MLSQKNRIRKKNDFENIFKKGKTFKSGSFIVRIARNSFDVSRFTTVTSQKVSKKAVIRNKIRRRVSAIIRKNFSEIKPGYDSIIIATPSAKNLEFGQIKGEIENIFKKAGILR